MPLVFDFALRRLSTIAAASPKLPSAFPDTYREFRRILQQADREPVAVHLHDKGSKRDFDMKVGAFVLQFAVKSMLPNGQKVGRIPALVYSVARGDTSLLTGIVQDLYNGLMAGFTAMQFGMSCSEGWSAARRQLALEQAPHSIFGDAPFIHLDTGLCDEVRAARPTSDSLLPVWSSVPVLLVAGTLDGNTPEFQAAEVLWGFPNGGFVTVENGFHETLPSPDVQAVVAEFLDGSDIRRRVIRLDPPDFLTIEEAKASKQSSR